MSARVRGQRLLIVVVSRSRATEVAIRLRVHKSNVTRWITGETSPSAEHKAQLEQTYGVPAAAWCQQLRA